MSDKHSNLVLIGGYSEGGQLLSDVVSIFGTKTNVINFCDYRSLILERGHGLNIAPNSTILAHSIGSVCALYLTSKFPSKIDRVFLVDPVGQKPLGLKVAMSSFCRKTAYLTKELFRAGKSGDFARKQLVRLLVGGVKEAVLHPACLFKCLMIVAFPKKELQEFVGSSITIHSSGDLMRHGKVVPSENTFVIDDDKYGHDSFTLDTEFIKKLKTFLALEN